ncbi:MAG: TIGR01777 family oxidoreductase, partial [Candidatus Phosphoribacter sp.]
MAQRIAVTGASGLIGSALTAHLTQRGDDVVRLMRQAPSSPQERQWSPEPGGLDPLTLADVDAVVHLAGAGVGDKRWSGAYKELILRSRIEGTRAVSQAIAASGRPIRLVTASAIGFYGDRGQEVLTESSEPGSGFLAEVVRAWEGATVQAVDAGSPVAHARFGLVMAPGGGAFERILTLTRFGLGGPLGRGRQYWSWITLHDVVHALGHLIDRPELVGPANVVGPDPRPQRVVARALGR